MKKLYYFNQKNVGIILNSILIFFSITFSFAGSFDSTEEIKTQINISAKLFSIPDEAYKQLHDERRFLNLADTPEVFRHLDDKPEESEQWQQIAVFSYKLDNISLESENPFNLPEETKSQYGVVLAKGSRILIAFKGSNPEQKPHFLEVLSSHDSTKVYDFYPNDCRMVYARHFFDVPDGYSYGDRSSLYKLIIGSLNPTDWSMAMSASKTHKDFLYAALSCQEEVFNLVDQYRERTHLSHYNIELTGHIAGAGVSTMFSLLLHQKFEEERKLENQNSFKSERIDLSINLLNFERPAVFNDNAQSIFREKIGNDRITNILSPENQQRLDNLTQAICETIRSNDEVV